MIEILVKTNKHDQLVDITDQVARFVETSGVRSGAVLIYCPHTTAGIVINEGADPDVARDILTTLNVVFPWNGAYRHMEGNAAAHIKSMVVGPEKLIPIQDGRMTLGRWQHIFFAEFDGPRSRTVRLGILPFSPGQ